MGARKRKASPDMLRVSDGEHHQVKGTTDPTLRRLMALAKGAKDVNVELPDGSTKFVPAAEIRALWQEKVTERVDRLREKGLI